jgi:hypothetical protein
MFCILGVISDFPFEEEEEMLRDRLYRRFCSWSCCPCWLKFQEIVSFIILDAFVDLFITICILANTAFMAADQYPKSDDLAEVLYYGNYVRVISTHILECTIKQELLHVLFKVLSLLVSVP